MCEMWGPRLGVVLSHGRPRRAYVGIEARWALNLAPISRHPHRRSWQGVASACSFLAGPRVGPLKGPKREFFLHDYLTPVPRWALSAPLPLAVLAGSRRCLLGPARCLFVDATKAWRSVLLQASRP